MDNNPSPLDNTNNVDASELSDLSQPLSPTDSTPQINTPPVVQQEQVPGPLPEKPKKKKAPLIVAIIIVLFILIGGGSFAIFAVIKNQPDNIARDAMQKLISSKNVVVNGRTNVTLDNANFFGVESVNFDFGAKTSGVNYASDLAISVNLSDGSTIALPKIGQVMLNNGIFYLKLDDLGTIYASYRDLISSYLTSIVKSRYEYVYTNKCSQEAIDVEEMLKCYDTDTEIVSSKDMVAIHADVESILEAIDEIVEYIDGKWFEISLDNILNDNLMSWVDESTRSEILKVRDCTVDKMNHFDQYSNELAELYGKYSFVSIAPASDSFYDISFKVEELTHYINSVPSTNLYKDISSCFGNSAAMTTIDVQSNQVASALEYLPNISAKFEGFLDHQLTDLKISKKDNYYTFNSNLSFDYSDDITVSAPSSSIPVMELVHKVYDLTVEVQSGIYGDF